MTTLVRSLHAGRRVRRSWVPVGAVLAMVTASDFEFRVRDVNAALEGSVDLAIALELVVYFGIGGLLFLGAWAPRGRRLPTPLAALWAYSAGLAVSALWAPSLELAMVRGIQLLILAGLATVLARRADLLDFTRIAAGYVALMTVFIGVGLVWRVAPTVLVANRFNYAATHPVVFAALLVTSVMILLAWTRRDAGPRPFSPALVRTLLAVHSAALLATQTRGAIFAAVVGVLVWAFLAVHRRQDVLVISACLAPLAIWASAGAIRDLVLRGESIDQLQTLNSRTTLWAEAVTAVSDNPLIGRGYFSAREIFLQTTGLGGAHNAYIEVLVSFGLIGVVLLTTLIVQTTRALRDIRRTPQGPMLAAIFASLLANGLTAQYWAQGGTGSSVWFAICIAWVTAVRLRLPTAQPPRTGGGQPDRGRSDGRTTSRSRRR